MKTYPIIMSGPMVCALLEDRKHMTRRVVKPQPTIAETGFQWNTRRKRGHIGSWSTRDSAPEGMSSYCPYGQPGDLLWVRETWALSIEPENHKHARTGYTYRADWDVHDDHELRDFDWKPSIHMPRWASRLTLEITDVRVERVQDISEDDAKAEGIEVDECGHAIRASDDIAWGSARGAFAELWESIHGDGAWTVNSWVWVLAFRVHHCNIDNLIKQKTT